MDIRTDPNFIKYVVTTLLTNANLTKLQGGKYVVAGLNAIPGFNQGEQFTSIDQVSDRLVSALQRQYESSAGSSRQA
jgi:hypothetical protein